MQLKTQLFIMVVMAAAVMCLPPFTFPRFSASFQQTLSVQLDKPLGVREESLRSVLAANGVPQSAISRMERDVEAGLLNVDMSIGGTVEVDFSNNIVLQNLDTLSFTVKDITGLALNVTVPVSESVLLYFDLNKNFTWSPTGGCSCNPIEGLHQMFVPFVPPFATFNQSTNININGISVSVDQWTANIPFGFNLPFIPGNMSLFDMSWSFYVKTGTTELASIQYHFSIPEFTVNTAITMWSVLPITTNAIILPDTSCAGLCQPVVNTVPAFPKCTSPTSVCQCLAAVNQTFCGAVDWLVSNTIFNNETDQFIAMIYQEILHEMSAVGVVPPQCQLELKSFLCKFYFPLCGSSNSFNFVKPPLNFFTCNVSQSRDADGSNAALLDAAYQTAPFSAYMAAEGKTQNHVSPNGDDGSSGLKGWQIALIVIGTVVGAAMLVAVVAIYLKKRRGNYSAL